jgi:hypothetical protein
LSSEIHLPCALGCTTLCLAARSTRHARLMSRSEIHRLTHFVLAISSTCCNHILSQQPDPPACSLHTPAVRSTCLPLCVPTDSHPRSAAVLASFACCGGIHLHTHLVFWLLVPPATILFQRLDLPAVLSLYTSGDIHLPATLCPPICHPLSAAKLTRWTRPTFQQADPPTTLTLYLAIKSLSLSTMQLPIC